MNKVPRPVGSDGPMEVWTDHGICVLNRIFVRGIPSKMTELQLEVLFGGMGYEVQNVRIVEDVRTGASKGYGFVTFRTTEEAKKVQQMGLVQWKGKFLQIDAAVKRKSMMLALDKQNPVSHGMQASSSPLFHVLLPQMAPTVLTDTGSSISARGNAWSPETMSYQNNAWMPIYM